MIAVFPGSFKPPHSGHFSIIKNLLKNKDIKQIIILISQKPRPLNNKLRDVKTVKEARELTKKYIKNTNKLSLQEIKKKINELLREDKIPSITQEESYEIWKLYLELLPKKKREKIKIMKSRAKSPVQNGYVIKLGKDEIKKGNKIIFIKSAKNAGNKRFGFYDMVLGKDNVEYLEIPEFKNLSSTNMRDLIKNKKYNELKKFLPKEILIGKIKKILNLR